VKQILLCSKSKSLIEHWKESIIDIYLDVIVVTSENGLIKSLENNSESIILLDSNFFTNVKAYLYSIIDSFPKVSIIFMDDCPSFKIGKELLPFGIKGYANSRLSSVHLLQALGIVNDGKMWLYPEFIQKLIKEASIGPKLEENKNVDSLTNKERQISLLVSRGCSNKVIAYKLDIAESTVKVHLRKIFRKLYVTDRLSLALIFR